MSFIYAERDNEFINIYCDTKITFADHIGQEYSREQAKLVQVYGIVKTIVITPEISISFAGNKISLASELCYQLYEKKTILTQELLDMAFTLHKENKEDVIEFIIVSCEDNKPTINCIKNRTIARDVSSAWIGSSIAQSSFLEKTKKENKGTHEAFLEVVNGCSDENVGGFMIQAQYNPIKKSIGYSECITFQVSKPQTVKAGEAFQLFMSNQDGGFSFEQVPKSVTELQLVIEQMDKDILYTRVKRLKEDLNSRHLFGMMLPLLVEKEEREKWIELG